MPSASTKVEITASSEALEPIKKVLTVVDKKVRNLEKRKQKLDAYREKQESGDQLEKDQQVAVDRYGEVVQNLEFARDLQKQFTAISADAEKLLKKQAKRGKSEKQLNEVKRVREVLQVQGLLDSMGSDTVRKDFQSGKHGAIVLTEENLEQLDELYKLISPTRDGETNYHESLSTASDHIVSLLDAKEKAVVGTTYKELKELIDLISGCGYFENAPYKEPDTTKEETTGDIEFEVVEHRDVPSPDSEAVQLSLPPEVKEEPIPQEPQATQLMEDSSTLNTQPQIQTIAAEADSFFSSPVTSQAVEQQQAQQAAAAAAAFNNRQRPFQEIVSSVQGSFNFLQESTIEMEAKREFSPHMDPAVVAAHPMPQSQSLVRPPSTNPEATSLTQTGFGTSSYGEQQSLEKSEISVVSSHTAPHSDPSILSQSTNNSVQSQDYTNSSFTQSSLTHSIQADNLFSGAVSSTDKSAGNIASHTVLGKAVSNDATLTQFEIPPQIPMPPGHDQQSQEDQQQTGGEKKSYPMNPNASEFQSLIYNPAQGEEGESNKSTNDSNNFQGSSYSNNYQGRDQRGGRGGYRGERSDRGGSRVNNRGGGMSNGFSRGGRGGGGGGRNSGYERSNSGGGGGSYQGYPPRNDYRPEGYQGYGGNNFNSGNFQKRDGSGGAPRGSGRGGSRGGSNYSRGGSGGFRGGPNRGGNNQGFGRPNFNQQQTTQ